MSTKKPTKKVKAKGQPKAAPSKELSEEQLDQVAGGSGGSGGDRPLKSISWSGKDSGENPME